MNRARAPTSVRGSIGIVDGVTRTAMMLDPDRLEHPFPTDRLRATGVAVPAVRNDLARVANVRNAVSVFSAWACFAALVALFAIVAPEAFGSPLRIDSWPVHLALVAVATLAIGDSVVGAAVTATGSRLPLSSVFGLTSAPGLWLTVVGLAIWLAGVAQIVDARDDR